MGRATVILLVLHYLLLSSTSSTASAAYLGLGAFLSEQYRRDPQANNDSFLSLPTSLKRSLAVPSIQNPPTPNSLLSLQVSVPITVKLVGPTFTSSSPSLLSSFVASAVSSDQYHVITPLSSSDSHHLSLSHSLHLDVSLSSPSLANRLSEALKTHLSSTPAPIRNPLTGVPYNLIDKVIQEDFERDQPVDGIYIYILHLGSQSKNYAYSYTAGDPSPGVTKCMGSVWTGKERYMWIDLGAGPVDYGPALSGDGVLPRGEFHPMATMHGRPKSQKALLADLASLVWSAYQVLFVPSLRIPVPFENSLIVQFIHIRGSSSDTYGLDWKSIERSFTDEVKGMLLPDQKLSFKNYEIKYSECALCAFTIARATTSYTSRYLFENYTLIVSEYLDSKRLHQTISKTAEEFRRLASLPEEDFGSRVLPVYVFDLDVNTILLLDRYHQSVSFKDMVIAVRTKNTQTVSDYSCNGRHVFTQTRELERPLVGSILQSMWGVSPTHLMWSPRHNSTLVDYTWSIGQTPFGPFSEISSLSFVQKDAAKRNVLLTTFNYTISSAIDVLESISAYGGEGKIFRKNRQIEFTQRWNLFKYKLDKAISSLSHFDYEMALFYLRSSDTDLYAIHSFVYHASQELEATLTCFKDPPFPWGSVTMSAGVFVALIYVYSKREMLFKNKRKQF
ncbi:OLC1v1009493C1 [Oldenlandia corymbosa var. corymbosa]|uniref:OLC1v1009493C1 n=1 Tax=Oldenlandia corymbosa var. corymbosa TaxID=529605 RepID=A0AAV1DS02_OLDCO|nr:OLC1v1009493C1 [Oldenlandia corymbosa var. corymbosa]